MVIAQELESDLQVAAKSSGCELLECDFRAGTLRLVIDRAEGVTLQDCETVSKLASAVLDVADFGSGRYLLEVSSPGLNRKLYSESDYPRFIGRKLRVTWKDPAKPRKQTDVGILESFSSASREVVLIADNKKETLTVALDTVQEARLEPEF